MVEVSDEGRAQVSAPSTAPRIVVCCDGSWCGDGTDTTSNVEIFAAAFAGRAVESMRSTNNSHYYNMDNEAAVAYFDGVGTNGSVVEYLLNGALALDIKELCVEAYRFIVQQYNPSAWDNMGSQIYFIGLSRGAYTVRMVASMINNLGILRRDKYRTEKDLKAACEEVYDMHANDDDEYSPKSPTCVEFRRVRSHATKRPPIKFMGLFDTVGDFGVPFINAGDRLRYGTAKQFYDQKVSSEVECVYQALALTDRMSLFTPCYVHRSPKVLSYEGVQYRTEQMWFPGSHYDIGRQRFVLLRSNDSWAEAISRWGIQTFNLLKLNITYTSELANPPFEYLVKALRDVDPGALAHDGAWYINKYSKDELPPTWKVLWFKPLTIDAYDGIADAESSGGPIARLVRWSVKTAIRHLLPGVSLTLRAIKGAIELIVTKQLLLDRHVPLWFRPKDFGNRPYLLDCNGRTYKSRALETYLLMRLQEGEPSPVPSAAAAGGAAAMLALQGNHPALPPTEGHPMPSLLSIAAEQAGAAAQSVQGPSTSIGSLPSIPSTASSLPQYNHTSPSPLRTDTIPPSSPPAFVAAASGAAPPPQPTPTESALIPSPTPTISPDAEVSTLGPPLAPSTNVVPPPSALSHAAAAHGSPSAAGVTAPADVGVSAALEVGGEETGHGGVEESKGGLSEEEVVEPVARH